MKLNVPAFALAFALWWGGSVFFLTWWVILSGGADPGPSLAAQIYFGYSVTPLGSLVGLAWGFADGLVGGALLAWLYNLLAAKLARGEAPAAQRQAS